MTTSEEQASRPILTAAYVDRVKAARYDFIIGWLSQVMANEDSMSVDEIQQMVSTVKRQHYIDGTL